jgi:uncharacterized protein (TIGR02466 family)
MKLETINCQHLFPTVVWMFQYEGFEQIHKAIEDEMNGMDRKAGQGARGQSHVAGSGGSEDIAITLELVPAAREIVEAFAYHCNRIAGETGWDLEAKEFRITGLWVHVTPPDANTRNHHHLPNHLSCAYYLKTPAGCGNLRLVDDRKYRALEPNAARVDAITGKFVEIPARERLMVVFPGSTSHQVGENTSGQSRISLGMNALLTPSDGAHTGSP